MNPLKLANPVFVTRTALGLAGSAAGLGVTVVREGTRLVAARLEGSVTAQPTTPEPVQAPEPSQARDDLPGPDIVLAEPAPPAEPPVDVVGQALAAETHRDGDGLAHEPRGASRDEEHGDATLLRAEEDEIAEEAEATLEEDLGR